VSVIRVRTVSPKLNWRNSRKNANGWLENQHQQLFYSGIGASKKRWTKCISVAGDCVEKWQNTIYTLRL